MARPLSDLVYFLCIAYYGLQATKLLNYSITRFFRRSNDGHTSSSLPTLLTQDEDKTPSPATFVPTPITTDPDIGESESGSSQAEGALPNGDLPLGDNRPMDESQERAAKIDKDFNYTEAILPVATTNYEF